MVDVNQCVIIFKSASDRAYYIATTVCNDVKFFIFSMCVLYFVIFHNMYSCTYV